MPPSKVSHVEFQSVTASACLTVFGEKTVAVNVLRHLITLLSVIEADSTFFRDGNMLGSLAFVLVLFLNLFYLFEVFVKCNFPP